MSILIYGATGYTGKLTARMAREIGVPVVLSGRNEEKLRVLGAETGFAHTTVDLNDTPKLLDVVAQHDVVLHIAGPFSKTASPMVEACLSGGTHYLDITGELAVFEAHRDLDRRARELGVMIMSGVGFDVVPSDCLALHMKERMPDAIRLTLAIRGPGSMSHGTAKTAMETIDLGTATREKGAIVYTKRPSRRQIQFGNETIDCVGISWGDVATGYHTTGIPDIAVYFASTKDLENIVGLPGFVRWLFATRLGQRFIHHQIEKQPEGPDPEREKTQTTQIVGIVENAAGQELRSLLTTPGPYYLTAQTALRIAGEVDGARFEPGTRNPAQLFGAGFITTFERCAISDLG